MEIVRVIRFAECKKKLGASHVLASLIGRAIEKFDFKRSQLERRENSIFRTLSEVNKPFATDLRLVIICFKLLKTVLSALTCSYEKKHVLCEPESKSFSVSKGTVFENFHIKTCVYLCIKRYLVEHNS